MTSFCPNWTENIVSKEKTVVLFYAGWCPHCQTFMPIWNELQQSYNSVKYGSLNVEDEPERMAAIRKCMPGMVPSYPSLVLYQNGSPITRFSGNRSIKNIIAWIEEN